ncbi:hypothetical protein [Pontibacter akesuensis]|uniref:Outer membrane protein beta-barrel domain-containing protein n=1 Tax=Pontibacter akesuensis TaxID=388950 RepID=A0A1I7IE30_9BACT|nr:hypothetical protein [Pontibacter akesuensis]GHA66740.1 hypothetical protein GCM10007389_19760 [Pontibacter akesuensis]SFU71223.1 hypothetical protein SAMN04487941_2144 [Pontibacter akesuensis]
MRNKLLLLTLLLCLCQLAQAQTTDSTTAYRHHIGLNTRVVLDRVVEPASLTPLQLIYKYQLSPRSALRATVEGFYATSDSSQSYSVRRDEVTNQTLGGSLGYERQKLLNKVFVLYYGADIFYRREEKSIEMFNRFVDPSQGQIEVEVHVEDRYVTNAFGLRPFVGLRINVSKQFYLSTETAFSLRRERSTQDYIAAFRTYSKDGAIGNPQTTTDYTTHRTNIAYVPINGITLNWLF